MLMNSFAACGIGRWELWATTSWRGGSSSTRSSWKAAVSFYKTVVRHKRDAKADTRQVDQKIVAAKLNFRHEVELEPLKLAVQELTRRTLAVEHQNRVLQQLLSEPACFPVPGNIRRSR